MMVLKKKEIVAAALVVLIGVAGYLNWSYQDTIRVTDGEIYSETGKRLGEAQYVNSSKEDVVDEDSEETVSKNSFSSAKLEKETARSKSLEILNQTAENENFDDDTRKKAQERILNHAQNVEKESVIENIAKAKGYPEIAVYVDGEKVDLIVKKDDFNENDAVKLKDIVTEQLGINANDIKIVQVK